MLGNYDHLLGEVNKKIETDMKILPEHVVAARALLKWTQEDLAKACQLNRWTISGFEAGTNMPSEDSIEHIRLTLVVAGIEFYNGGNPGVRLMRSKDGDRRQSTD